ncbi:DUF4169 family protein [Sphingomonas faeni]|uniref:DUF4169 family protein n=1 Tax=Sphingomonas faeni TaxID=185950 RepID=UPI0020C7C5DB|nr:DUF4169 family protein [Sphingomonas faeni]
MGEVINLRLARKQRARSEAVVRAEGNRRLFGRTGAEKAAEAAERARVRNTLDGAKLDSPTPDKAAK